MPTYTYEREDGSRFDYIQKMNDDKLTECPETGQPVRRLIGTGSTPIIKGWSPDKEWKRQRFIGENPHGTTLPEYQKQIDENTQKAREMKGK
jgi:putative FmdB family regulatory protein